MLFSTIDESEDHPYASLLMMPIGNVGYLFTAQGDIPEIQERVYAIAQHIAEAEPSEEPVTVHVRGSATGGPFDAMPGRDDTDVLAGLVPLYDYDLLVSDSPILPPRCNA